MKTIWARTVTYSWTVLDKFFAVVDWFCDWWSLSHTILLALLALSLKCWVIGAVLLVICWMVYTFNHADEAQQHLQEQDNESTDIH
jgi:hypothetical protein